MSGAEAPNPAEAAKCKSDLELRVYTSRLLGRNDTLVLHGGGNTSVKVRERNVVGDEEILEERIPLEVQPSRFVEFSGERRLHHVAHCARNDVRRHADHAGRAG